MSEPASAVKIRPPSNARQLVLNGVFGLMVVPYCPHEGCGWSMPELYCQEHGNWGITFLSARIGVLTHVKAVLDRPFAAPGPAGIPGDNHD